MSQRCVFVPRGMKISPLSYGLFLLESCEQSCRRKNRRRWSVLSLMHSTEPSQYHKNLQHRPTRPLQYPPHLHPISPLPRLCLLRCQALIADLLLKYLCHHPIIHAELLLPLIGLHPNLQDRRHCFHHLIDVVRRKFCRYLLHR